MVASDAFVAIFPFDLGKVFLAIQVRFEPIGEL
jgi:hypothetical protein